jgi:hypothetical protein
VRGSSGSVRVVWDRGGGLSGGSLLSAAHGGDDTWAWFLIKLKFKKLQNHSNLIQTKTDRPKLKKFGIK